VRERQVFAVLPSAAGALAEVAPGRPSAGGQRTIRLARRALLRSPERPSESRMAQRSAQRLEGLQRLLPWSLAGAFTFAPHGRPNPSVNGGPGSAVLAEAVPPLSATYLQR
jgi:hypothetical protein